MVDIETDLSTLYVMSDDFCKRHLPAEVLHPGPQASLSRSEVVTLALFGQWVQFKSERAFYRYAELHLRAAFPALPDRSQFNRLMRQQRDAITAFSLHLVELLEAQHCLYEALDSTAAVTRDAKRRGRGWLAGQADRGWSNRLGWYEGFHLLLCVNPMGVITGFGFGARSHTRPIVGLDLVCGSPASQRASGKSLGCPPKATTERIKARLSSSHTDAGRCRQALRSSPHLIKAASANAGRKRCDGGWPALGKSLKRSMTSC